MIILTTFFSYFAKVAGHILLTKQSNQAQSLRRSERLTMSLGVRFLLMEQFNSGSTKLRRINDLEFLLALKLLVRIWWILHFLVSADISDQAKLGVVICRQECMK